MPSRKPICHKRVEVAPSLASRRLLWFMTNAWHSSRFDTKLPARHPYLKAAILMVEAGAGWINLAGQRRRLERGANCYLYNLRDSRGIRSDRGRPLKTRGIIFGGASLQQWLTDLDVARQPVFEVADSGALRKSMVTIARLAARQASGWEIAVHREIGGILEMLMLSRDPRHEADGVVSPLIASVVEVVEAAPERFWTAQEMAAAAGMSSSAFRARFRAAMQMSIREYLLALKAETARNLLLNPSLRIKQVADRLQFSSEAHFSRFFSRETGTCPSAFRKLMNGGRDGVSSRQLSRA
jgi:AraC-like DNA-binding protein